MSSLKSFVGEYKLKLTRSHNLSWVLSGDSVNAFALDIGAWSHTDEVLLGLFHPQLQSLGWFWGFCKRLCGRCGDLGGTCDIWNGETWLRVSWAWWTSQESKQSSDTSGSEESKSLSSKLNGGGQKWLTCMGMVVVWSWWMSKGLETWGNKWMVSKGWRYVVERVRRM